MITELIFTYVLYKSLSQFFTSRCRCKESARTVKERGRIVRRRKIVTVVDECLISAHAVAHIPLVLISITFS